MAEIIVANTSILVDDEDYSELSQYTWCIRMAKDGKHPYGLRNFIYEGKPTTITMHRHIMGLMPGDKRTVAHLDKNGLNNIRANLEVREAGYRKPKPKKPRVYTSSKPYPYNSPDYKLDSRMWTLYRIRLADYRALVEKQNGVCAICARPPADGTRLYIDHCHNSEAVRGLLCQACNTAIGQFQDDTDRMLRAIQYLQNG